MQSSARVHALRCARSRAPRRFRAPARIAVLVRGLRREVDRLLVRGEPGVRGACSVRAAQVAKIKQPALDVSASPVTAALLNLLTSGGF